MFNKTKLFLFLATFILILFTGTEILKAASWATLGTSGFSSGVVGYTSITLDSTGSPYVTFTDVANSSKATVMKYNGSAWVTVGTAGFSVGTVYNTVIRLDSSNTPYVAFTDNANSSKISVMKYNGSAWVLVGTAGFSTGAVNDLDLVIDSSNIPYVVYRDEGDSSKATVKKYNGSAWVALGSTGFSADEVNGLSIDVDSSNVLYVGYSDVGSSGKATVMKYNGSAWVLVGTAGFSADSAGEANLKLDNNNVPYIGFEDASVLSKATVMKYNGSSWVLVGTAGFNSVGSDAVMFPMLAFDSSNNPYISFVDNGNGDKATVMKYNGSSWNYVGTAGFSDGVTLYTTMVMDSNDAIYVVYSDDAHSDKATVVKYTPDVVVSTPTPEVNNGVVPIFILEAMDRANHPLNPTISPITIDALVSPLGLITSGTYKGEPIMSTETEYNFTKTLKYRSRNSEVKELQQFLNDNGYIVSESGAGSPGLETTSFKTKTKEAVIKFQVDNGLKADGVVGKQTREIMNSMSKPVTEQEEG